MSTASPDTQATAQAAAQAFIDRWKPSGAAGHIRWLRPDYQATEEAAPQDLGLDVEPDTTAAVAQVEQETNLKQLKADWPDTLPEQVKAVRQLLAHYDNPVDPKTLTRHFGRATKKRTAEVSEIFDTLVLIGQATQQEEDGGYVGK